MGLGEDGCCGLHHRSCAKSVHHADHLWQQKLLEKWGLLMLGM